VSSSLQRRSGSAYRGRRAPPPSLRSSWERQGWPLRILRAFLGATFVYAGLQKFLDPNFLHAGMPDYVGTQLRAFAVGSPIRPVLLVLDHVPVLAGVGVALTEVAAGVGTLFGIAPIAWAAVGLGINVVLFLSATWHVHPYFLGSDSMYAVGWGAYLAGLVEIRHRASKGAVAHGTRRERARAAEGMPRREFMRGAAVAAGAVILGVTSSVLAGPPTRRAPPAVPAPGRKPRPGSSSPTGAGTEIASLDSVPVGGAVAFDDPRAGPSVLCRLAQDRVAAYSRVCTHAGCLVEFDPSARLLVCPCHGAQFDPTRGAEVVAGPAPGPLSRIPVTIDRASGQVVALA